MILADTNIVSTFSRVDALDLVVRLFRPERIHLASATFTELRRAVEAGCSFLEPVLAAAEAGNEILITSATPEEVIVARSLPSSLGLGEAESIAVCLSRPGTRLLTNDKRARNYCRERGVRCLDLAAILRAIWIRNVATRNEVADLIRTMEMTEGLVIKNKQEILR